MVKQLIFIITILLFLFVGVPSIQALSDFDNDNDTDYQDLLSLVSNFHLPVFPAWLDQNQDSRLDLFDFNRVISFLGITPPAASPTHLDSVAGGGTNTTTISTATPVTGGNYQYLAVITARPNADISSVNGLGLTWTKLDTQCSYRHTTGIEVWSAQGTGTTGIVTAVFTGPVNAGSLEVSRFAGVSTATPIGTVISANTNGTESTICNYVTDTSSDTNAYSLSLSTASPVLIYNAVAIRSATHIPGSGFTEANEIYTGTGGDTAGIATQFKPVAAPGTTTVTGSLSGPVDWAVIAVELKGRTSTPITPTLYPTPTLTPAPPATKAFPGAVGYGTDTPGGRGGRVIFVTNLNDSGSGSLRQAAEVETGPRLVLFKVSGVIHLVSGMIKITHPYVTIAGQTAPGNGIATRYSGISVRTHDVIIRGMKLRPADTYCYNNTCGPTIGEFTQTRDALNVSGSSTNGTIDRVVIDHNSLSWALDESLTGWTSDVKYVTYSNNIIAEALDESIHVDEGYQWPRFDPHSTGFYIGGAAGENDTANHITAYRNLFVSIKDRNPRLMGYNIDFINNVIYNWAANGAMFTRVSGGTYAVTANFYGNLYLRGPSTRCNGATCVPGYDDRPIRLQNSLNNARIYMDENFDDYFHPIGDTGSDWEMVWCNEDPSPPAECYKSPSPVSAYSIPASNIVPGAQVLNPVLTSAGASPNRRDPIDQGYIDDVVNKTGDIIDCIDACDISLGQTRYRMTNPWSVYTSATPPTDSDNDGMPNSWETSRGLNPNSGSDANLLAPSGYTWIEEYINSLIP